MITCVLVLQACATDSDGPPPPPRESDAIQLAGEAPQLCAISADQSTIVWTFGHDDNDRRLAAYRVASGTATEFIRVRAPLTHGGEDPVVLSADGAVAAFADRDGALVIARTDATSQHRLGVLAHPFGPRRTFVLSADGAAVLYWSRDGGGTFHHVDVATGADRVITTMAGLDLYHAAPPLWSPTNRWLLYPTLGLAYDVIGRQLQPAPFAMADGRFLDDDRVVARDGARVVRWSLTDGSVTPIATDAAEAVLGQRGGFAVVITHDTSGAPRSTDLYDLTTGQARQLCGVGESCAAALSPAGSAGVIDDADRGTFVFATSSGELRQVSTDHRAVSFGPDERWAVALGPLYGSVLRLDDGELLRWHVSSGGTPVWWPGNRELLLETVFASTELVLRHPLEGDHARLLPGENIQVSPDGARAVITSNQLPAPGVFQLDAATLGAATRLFLDDLRHLSVVGMTDGHAVVETYAVDATDQQLWLVPLR